MKRIYWINIICLLSITVLGSYLDFLFTIKDRWISILLILSSGGVFFYLESRKSPITLTEEEKQASFPERQDFSLKTPKSHWIDLAIGIPFFFAVMFLFVFAYFDLYKLFGGAPFTETLINSLQVYVILFRSISWWIVMGILAVLVFMNYIRKARNKYMIEGDVLIIQENQLFKTEEEIRIPLDTIDEVYMRFYGSGYNCLYLNIQGIQRRLNTGVNSLSLGKAILQHKNSFSRFADSRQECR